MSRRKRGQATGNKAESASARAGVRRPSGSRLPASVVYVLPIVAGLAFWIQNQPGRFSRSASESTAVAPAASAPASTGTASPSFSEDPELTGYRVAARQHPESPDAQFRLGWALYSRGRYADAIPVMDNIVARDPDGRVYDLRAAARMASDRSPAGLALAIDDLQQATHQFPNWFQAHEDLGRAYAQGGRWKEASEELERSIALAPGQKHDYYDLMRAYQAQGRPAKAAEARAKFAAADKEVQRRYKLQSICTSQPNNADAFRELGLLALKNGLYSVSIQYLGHAAHLRPNDAGLQSDLRRAQEEWKQSDKLSFGAAAKMP